MATILTFYKNGRFAKAGLEVALHWSSTTSTVSKYRTDSRGRITIEDDRISGDERRIELIFIQNPDGGYSLTYSGYVVTKGVEHQLHLEQATRQ